MVGVWVLNMILQYFSKILFSICLILFLSVFKDSSHVLADKTIINPVVAMWAPNILFSSLSYYLYKLIDRENVNFSLSTINILKGFTA